MKHCQTCGKPHPDDVTTSHHPKGCTCGSTDLHSPDGNNASRDGCIWHRAFTLPGNLHNRRILAELKMLEMLAEMEKVDQQEKRHG